MLQKFLTKLFYREAPSNYIKVLQYLEKVPYRHRIKKIHVDLDLYDEIFKFLSYKHVGLAGMISYIKATEFWQVKNEDTKETFQIHFKDCDSYLEIEYDQIYN